jgi:hypothetical protein
VAKQHRGWGGKRAGSGPEKQRPDWERYDVAHDYAEARDLARAAKRKTASPAIKKKLAKQHGMTERYVARCLDEFYPGIRAENAAAREKEQRKKYGLLRKKTKRERNRSHFHLVQD